MLLRRVSSEVIAAEYCFRVSEHQPPAQTQEPPKNKITRWISENWKRLVWVIVLLVCGVLATVFAFASRYFVGVLQWDLLDKDDLSVVQSVLTNLGTAFIAAVILLFFEPLLAKVIKNTAVSAATEVVEDRVQSIEARVESLIDDEIQDQDQGLDFMARHFEHQSVHRAMSQALETGAIDSKGITVQATDTLGEFVVTLGLSKPADIEDHRDLFLRAMTSRGFGPIKVYWNPHENFENVAARLVSELSKVKAWGKTAKVPWDQVTHRLASSLKAAVKSQQLAPGFTHFRGVLWENISDRWFFTDGGLEAPEFGVYVETSKWPPFIARGKWTPPRTPAFDQPTNTSKEEWEYVLRRGDSLHAMHLDAGGNELPRALQDDD